MCMRLTKEYRGSSKLAKWPAQKFWVASIFFIITFEFFLRENNFRNYLFIYLFDCTCPLFRSSWTPGCIHQHKL
jgi:hypothetical protein